MPPLQIEQKYECTTCNLSVNSLIQLQQHFKGRKHKAKMPADSRNNISKATDFTSSSKLVSFSHPFGHQNVLNTKHNQEKSTTLSHCADFEGFEEVPDFEGFSEQLVWEPRVHEAVLEEQVQNMVDRINEPSSPRILPRVQRFSINEVHLHKDFKCKGHVLAAVVPQYNSKKVAKKYPNKGKSCSSEISNPKSHLPLTTSQKEVGSSVYLQNVYGLQNQHEISYSYKDPSDSNEKLITKTIAMEISNQATINHKSKIQHAISSQKSTQKYHNFSIENILQTGNNSFNKNNISNSMLEKNLALNQLNEEYPITLKLPSFSEKIPTNFNLELDRKEKLQSTSNDKNPRPIISVRKDLISPVNINQVDREYCNTAPVSNVTQSKIETLLQPVEKSILTSSISNQDVKIAYSSNSKTLTETNSTTPFIRAPLEAIDKINSPTTLQNITSTSSSHNKLQIKKKNEMSLKCYTCNKDVFDSLGNSKSLIYDHLIFGRASCKTCSKTVSCSGFTKLSNSNSGCCNSDQLVFTNNPVYYLIGELDNCEKNPCYYLAEYMMKIKVLWIYMPWCQAVVDVKKFVKNPFKIPSFIFKGQDVNKSTKQITPINKQKEDNQTTRGKLNDREIRTVKLINKENKYPRMKRLSTDKVNEQITPINKQKEDNHTTREKLNDREIRTVKSINKENKYPRMKRLLTDKVIEHEDSCISPPAKKIKSTLRTLRIKKEFIDNCELQEIESSENYNTTHIDCTDSINDMTSVTKYMPKGNVEFQHKQQMDEINNPSNCNRKNERHSKLDYNPTDNFAPQIIDVCSIKDLENPFKSDNAQISATMEKFKDDISNAYYSSQYNEKLNIDNDLELSCGSTIMTPDASPHTSPVDSTKLATGLLSKKAVSSNYINFTTLTGKICVSKYMQDVARINSNSLISEKTIEECPMCYQKLSLSKMTVNTENMVLQFICSCNLNIYILPNNNGKILWPFNDYDYKKSVRILKMRKKRVNKRKLRF